MGSAEVRDVLDVSVHTRASKSPKKKNNSERERLIKRENKQTYRTRGLALLSIIVPWHPPLTPHVHLRSQGSFGRVIHLIVFLPPSSLSLPPSLSLFVFSSHPPLPSLPFSLPLLCLLAKPQYSAPCLTPFPPPTDHRPERTLTATPFVSDVSCPLNPHAFPRHSRDSHCGPLAFPPRPLDYPPPDRPCHTSSSRHMSLARTRA